MAINKQLNVFVSSTSEDLKDYRATASFVILDVGWTPRMMEHMGAIPESTVSACQQMLCESDLVVLLVAFRQGWVPTKEQGGNGVDSITKFELEFAKEHNIPVLALLASDDWPIKLCEDDDNARKWIKVFRDNINLPADFFDYEDTSREESKRLPSFRAKLKTALINHKEQQVRKAEPETQLIEAARAGLLEGISIPLLGPALFGSGSLRPEALACGMGTNIAKDTACLATAAEYCEKKSCLSREQFLSKLKDIIKAQTSNSEATTVYDLILALKSPPLIVSTTHDLVLENRLQATKKIAIVCHVVRSYKSQHDGKILVMRSGEEPEIRRGDEVELGDVDYIIYKPLGSPLIHDLFSKDLQESEIDTVVITETDHLIFLSMLRDQNTGVPKRFNRPFQTKSFLFLGYTLDVWQYRLVMQMFQSVRMNEANPTRSFAVRQPGCSEMERLAWQRLGIDIIEMEPNEFAGKVQEDLKTKGELTP